MFNPLSDEQCESDQHQLKSCLSKHYMNTMDEMRKKNFLCDASIYLDDGSTFNIHRAILSASSEYFRALFTYNNENSNIHIPKIRKEIMEGLLQYAYIRQCELTESNVCEMLMISDYMAMIGLIQHCNNFIIQILKPDNCIGFWIFSRLPFCFDLGGKCLSYILRNFIEVAKLSEEIFNIKIDDFYSIISDDMLNAKDEKLVWECCLKWIDFDYKNRAHHITKLMHGVRLGLLDKTYFLEKVQNNPIVIAFKETKALVQETINFLKSKDKISETGTESITPAIAIPRLPRNILFAIGGWDDIRPLSYIEAYDIRSDRWIRVREEDPIGPRSYYGIAVIGYKIYCIGGFNGTEYFNTCRVFDPVRKSWKEIAPMHCRRCYVSVTVLDGFIYAIGGYNGEFRQNTAERYNPKTNQWSVIPSMRIPRSDADACTLNGKIYIIGGFNGFQCVNTAEYFDPVLNIWTEIASMIYIRSGVRCVAHGGFVYALGGFSGRARLRTAEKYDPEKNFWQPIQRMYHQRSNFGVAVIDDKIFVMGGYNGLGPTSDVECYIIETDEWMLATEMGMKRSAFVAVTVHELSNIKNYIAT